MTPPVYSDIKKYLNPQDLWIYVSHKAPKVSRRHRGKVIMSHALCSPPLFVDYFNIRGHLKFDPEFKIFLWQFLFFSISYRNIVQNVCHYIAMVLVLNLWKNNTNKSLKILQTQPVSVLFYFNNPTVLEKDSGRGNCCMFFPLFLSLALVNISGS